MMAEQKPGGGGMGEGSKEVVTAGDSDGDMHEGRMEQSSVKTLLDSISCFGLLSSRTTIKAEVVLRYCRTVDEILMLLKPVLEEAVLSEIIPDMKLTEVLIELDSLVNEARELLGSWHQMMSIVYFVLENEPIITKIQTSAVVTCQLFKSLCPPTVSAENVECFKKKIQLVHHEKIMDEIKEVIQDQINKRLPSSEHLEKISRLLNLSSNQELLMEAVALDKLKSMVGRGGSHAELEYIDHILALITYMHDCLVKVKQLHSINGVPIPPDFCCPLSLELMADPVIVASGQTYERAFIKKWLDQGFNVCPKSRQTLGHSNLTPNYTVKALIENWCESNNIKLADPLRSLNETRPSAFISPIDMKANDSKISPRRNHLERNKYTRSLENGISSVNAHKELASSNGIHQESYLPEKPASSQLHSSGSRSRGSSFQDVNQCDTGFARMSLSGSEDKNESRSEQRYVGSGDQTSTHFKQDFSQDSQEHIRSSSISNDVLDTEHHEEVGDARTVSRVYSDLTHTSNDASGEVMRETPTSAAQVEPDFISKFTDVRSRSQIFWRRPSDRFTPKMVSSPSLDSRPDLSGVETQVRKLVEDLRSDSMDVQRTATEELRLLAKHNMENRIVIANCGAIPLLVGHLNSTDPKTQENAVTALLNLSINDNNKTAIANADAIDPLVHVLETGNPEAKENSAATLFSLSVIEENKVRIGRSGAIKPLVELLGNGTRRGKKDAATALFNLSIFHENKTKIVQAGAVRYLVELMDPAAGMVDKAVAVLANLSTIPEGRTAIGREGGIPVLVEVAELGSARGKENAAAALLQLCTNSNRFGSIVLQEGAVPPLVALSQSGTPRAKEKAQALLSYFRTQRHGSAGRA
ncbi:U-box domain-containing protein 4-like isoform X1 [Dendrobium catenatum]|uniref:RING-type E3 ubiquitin transferase n=2 Tax=Dendrobium catenatum TaxID=906689 RepID=A0A2I0XD88_9ASPA|nr:U-box domain-containing protein 4-like isoform X1 [Dendrobium catenatum]PKU85866.1 U-box domain-containing protein 4 [Dendrobium catenatum]